MSDHWIIAIPEDPHHVPLAARQQAAKEWMLKVAPHSDHIELTTTERVQFFDCGSNFERVRCPRCATEIASQWWQLRMSKDAAEGFRLATYPTPCCGTRHTLHELVYD